MGTNYYIRNNICPTCKRSDEPIHLGKSSGGWDFSIHAIPDIYSSFKEFKKFIKGKEIFNEYDEKVTPEELLELIEIKKKAHPYAHKETIEKYSHGRYIEGYYFVDGEFC